MSTRGAIMSYDENGTLHGIYHGQDSYPTGLGSKLIDLYHNAFHKDYKAFVDGVMNQPNDWFTLLDWDGDNNHIRASASPILDYTEPPYATSFSGNFRSALSWWSFGFSSVIEYVYILEPYQIIALHTSESLTAWFNPLYGPRIMPVIDVYYLGWPKDKFHNDRRENYSTYYMPKNEYVRYRSETMKRHDIMRPFQTAGEMVEIMRKQKVADSEAN